MKEIRQVKLTEIQDQWKAFKAKQATALAEKEKGKADDEDEEEGESPDRK